MSNLIHWWLGACCAMCCITANAQTAYPTKPIRFIAMSVGFPENTARVIGNEITAMAKQQIVVDPRPGANGILAAEFVAKAPPDGYTLLVGTNSTHAANPRLSSVQRVQSATELARRKARELGIACDIDGEMQADAALNPFAAEAKEVSGSVAGKASVLIFPDLNAGNIASKMAQHIADIPAYGQILTGLERPAAEISRGASAHDIFGTAVIVAAQAVDKSYLYPLRKDGHAA